MDKVKLTQDQAQALQLFKKHGHNITVFARQQMGLNGWYESLKVLSIDDFAAAYFGNYEIKETFKHGDKVIFNEKVILTIEKKAQTENAWYDEKGSVIFGNEFRHATPEEIYWLETLGRERIGEFKLNDIFVNGNGEPELLAGTSPVDQYPTIEDAEGWYEIGYFKGLYPAESFAPFEKEVKTNG